MDTNAAIPLFETLAQETRLQAFRLLVQAGSDGMAAGAISDTLGVPHNTLSFHLNHLSQSGIVSSEKQGRSVVYFANFDTTRDLIAYLIKDCCHQQFASIREDKRKHCSIIELAQYCN